METTILLAREVRAQWASCQVETGFMGTSAEEVEKLLQLISGTVECIEMPNDDNDESAHLQAEDGRR